MRKVKDNKDVIIEINKMIAELDTSKVEIAKQMHVSRQRVTNILAKTNINFRDVVQIVNAIDCDLYIDIRQRDSADSTDSTDSNVDNNVINADV